MATRAAPLRVHRMHGRLSRAYGFRPRGTPPAERDRCRERRIRSLTHESEVRVVGRSLLTVRRIPAHQLGAVGFSCTEIASSLALLAMTVM